MVVNQKTHERFSPVAQRRNYEAECHMGREIIQWKRLLQRK